MPWSLSNTPHSILIYRNLATHLSFEAPINQVPYLDGSNPFNVVNQAADKFLGDYAPYGKRMSKEDFCRTLEVLK